MNTRDAVRLIGAAIPRGMATWADCGAGGGTFTRALAELLGAGSRIYAIDRDPRAVAALARARSKCMVEVIPVRADFTRPFELPNAGDTGLDGMVFANALHFVAEPERVLAKLAGRLRPGGRVVIVEYDRRPASRWVPYPIEAERFPSLAASAGLSRAAIVATRPSAFGGDLYVAVAEDPRGLPKAP